MELLERMYREDPLVVPEPRHINYFFYLNGIPERNIHSLEEIQEYLSRFSDWGFKKKLKLDFLNYLKKTYNNALISLENFDLNIIDERKKFLTMEEANRISTDTFVAEKLKSSIYFFGYFETLTTNTKKKVEVQNAKIDIIKNDFKNSILQIKKLLPQIDNEIEYYSKYNKLKKNQLRTTEKQAAELKITGKMVDVVRIFEAMFSAGIISAKTEIKQIAQLYFKDPIDIQKFVNNYNSQKKRIEDDDSRSSSKNLATFIKSLSDGLKKPLVEEIINHLKNIRFYR